MRKRLRQTILVTYLLKNINIRGLTIDNSIERKTNNDLFEPKLIEMGINDLLKKQLVGNLPISLNFVQSNDVPINLIIGFNFLRKICPKSYAIL
jgi:hypothetical protein